MAGELSNRTVGILNAPGSSEVDIAAVGQALLGVGAHPVILDLEGEGELRNGWERRPLADIAPGELDGVVVPGGIAGADELRASDRAVELVRQVFVDGKPVGTIGHGAWLLVEAGIAAGRTIAAAPGIRTGLENAGGTLAADGVRRERGLVTAAGSEHLADFVAHLFEELRFHVESGARAERREWGLDRVVEQSFPASDPAPGPSYL
jgi:protease I